MVSKKVVAQSIIERVEKEYEGIEIRTSLVEGYKRPDKIGYKGNASSGFEPDVMFLADDTTELYEIELGKTYKPEKWRAFSLYSSRKKGNLNIVAPEDDLPDLRMALSENGIKARVLYFS